MALLEGVDASESSLYKYPWGTAKLLENQEGLRIVGVTSPLFFYVSLTLYAHKLLLLLLLLPGFAFCSCPALNLTLFFLV